MWTILLCGNSLLGAREVGRRSGEEERRGHNKGGRKAKEYHKGINTKARKDKHGGRSERAPYTICSTTTFLPCWSNIFVSCQFFLSSLWAFWIESSFVIGFSKKKSCASSCTSSWHTSTGQTQFIARAHTPRRNPHTLIPIATFHKFWAQSLQQWLNNMVRLSLPRKTSCTHVFKIHLGNQHTRRLNNRRDVLPNKWQVNPQPQRKCWLGETRCDFVSTLPKNTYAEWIPGKKTVAA